MNASQKQELTATIETLVENRYFPRWEKIFGKGDVTYIGQSRRNGDILVSTNLRLGQKDDPLIFQLTAAEPRVVSLTVNKNDLLTKLTQRIQAHQAKEGYPAMIAWLKGKGKCDPLPMEIHRPARKFRQQRSRPVRYRATIFSRPGRTLAASFTYSHNSVTQMP